MPTKSYNSQHWKITPFSGKTRPYVHFLPFTLGTCLCGCNKPIQIKSSGRPTLIRFSKGHKYRSSKMPDFKPKRRTAGLQGYVKIGHAFEHRLVMEKYLGRQLQPNELVHHKNHDRTDNRIENLELTQSNRDHRILHAAEFREKILPKRSCNDCGTKNTYIWFRNPLNRSTYLCRKCYRRLKRAN